MKMSGKTIRMRDIDEVHDKLVEQGIDIEHSTVALTVDYLWEWMNSKERAQWITSFLEIDS